MDKITSWCNICKYTITNKLTIIVLHKLPYINYRVLFVSWKILARKASCMCCTQSSSSQLHITVLLHFILFFSLRF